MRTSAVDEKATIFPEFCELFYPSSDVQPCAWLVTYLVEDRRLRRFVMKDGRDRRIGEIEVERVISDDELKR